MYKQTIIGLLCSLMCLLQISDVSAQKKLPKSDLDSLLNGLSYRNIGPYRGGRTVASTGVKGQPYLYYMGTVGGGVWKTIDGGMSWQNISDGWLGSASVGAIEVADSNPNIIYVGMGEHAVRGVMTSAGDGMYKSMDGGKTWSHIGLKNSMHISSIEIHPSDPNIVYVGVQGAVHGATQDRGVYKTTDGGKTWKKTLFVNSTTAVTDVSLDANNPLILYASTWDNIRYPWQVRSGGKGSGIYKSKDGGETWERLKKGLPKLMGKTSVDVSPVNSDVVYANIEAEGKKGGVYRSNDGGQSWQQTCSDRVTVARSWYYIEIFADPKNENTVYVLNAPMLKSVDGGRTFKTISNPHTDQHHMWINPDNTDNIILSNDGGACITYNGGRTWSPQTNQPTAQFYRVITDNRYPYYIYGGQQDNSTVVIPHRSRSNGIGWKDWYTASGGESAFLAFDPDNPTKVYGTSIQGFISSYDTETESIDDIMAYPTTGLGWTPKEMKYRYNWNAPLVANAFDPSILYHGAQKVLMSNDEGMSWTEISPDLTRNDTTKQGLGGVPFTNEAAGGEVYNTLSYIACSPLDKDEIWTGSDCGLIHVTRDQGENWNNVTPRGLSEQLINCIDVSSHQKGKAFAAITDYKQNDVSPRAYVTTNWGKTWKKITNGIPENVFVRVVREDPQVENLLYAGTERGMYVSFNGGQSWESMNLNMPILTITDLTFRRNDLVIATAGRGFWVLDDRSTLHALKENQKDELALYDIKESFRFQSTKGTRTRVAKNAPFGVIIDYRIPEDFGDSTAVALRIEDENGNLVRDYSSEKDKTFKRFVGGPAPEKLLPKKKGVNRFVWDMRKENIPSLPGVMVLGGYTGSLVAPRKYKVQLISDGDTLTQWTKVSPEPNVPYKMADYKKQAELLSDLEGTLLDMQKSVIAFKDLKDQLTFYKSQLTKSYPDNKDIIKKADNAYKAIGKWEDKLIQRKQKTFQDVINFPNQLNAEIISLMGRISQGADPRVTKGAIMRSKELMDQWQKLAVMRDEILGGDVATFNTAYKALNLSPVRLLKKVGKS